MSFPTRSRLSIILIFLLVSSGLLAAAGFGAQSVTAKAGTDQVTLASYELIGTVSIPTGAQFQDTEIGGLSSITYDSKRGVYYAISDVQVHSVDEWVYRRSSSGKTRTLRSGSTTSTTIPAAS